MKNQYAGDVNDYKKFGLLRLIEASGIGKLLVAWMLTPDDGGEDGSKRSYLADPDEWRSFDPELFDSLKALADEAPSTRRLQEAKLLRSATFFRQHVPTRP